MHNFDLSIFITTGYEQENKQIGKLIKYQRLLNKFQSMVYEETCISNEIQFRGQKFTKFI